MNPDMECPFCGGQPVPVPPTSLVQCVRCQITLTRDDWNTRIPKKDNTLSGTGLIIYCCKCAKQIISPGALLFSPPDKDSSCRKEHICEDCYVRIQYQGQDDGAKED